MSEAQKQKDDVAASIKQKVADIPRQPGVYLMIDAKDKVIYVGKAKNLKSRVSSYFRDKHQERALTRILVRHIRDIKFIATTNEKEALLLERTLIAKEKPKYNIVFRDDKDYLSLRLSLQHKYPRLTVVRRPKRDGAAYFGPYASAFAARKMARYLYRLFPLRSCSDHVLKNRSRPCILYQINLCTAPCVDKITKEDYDRLVDQIHLFLKGRTKSLVKSLEEEMQSASKRMDYEQAAMLQSRIEAIKTSLEEQYVTFFDLRDMDVVGYAREVDSMAVAILTIRKGQIVGKREIVCSLIDEDHEAMTIESILAQHYLETSPFIPPVILVSVKLGGREALESAFTDKAERKVAIQQPKRGERLKLVKMANKNALLHLKKTSEAKERQERLLTRIQDKLKLPVVPERIETYDISNIQGTDAVGSQVTFIQGQACKAEYRKYRIKEVQGANDFAMLKEVLTRRFKSKRTSDYPQLIVIDGGKGQLSAAVAALADLNITEVALAAIAKVPLDGVEKNIVTDRIFVPGRRNPLALKPEDSVLKLFQVMRDEAHRFAVSYHRKVKHKRTLTSELLSVEGIGKKRMQMLLKHFGSAAKVKQASLAELRETSFLGPKLAEMIFKSLNTK